MAVNVESARPYRADWRTGRVASWLTTVDHKRIGILYIVTSLDLLRGGRRARAADPLAARDAGRAPADEELVQRGRDDARDDDDLPRHRPDPRRLRELPRAADDRRARHGVPAAERAVVLAVRARRRRAVPQLLRERRRGARAAGRRTRRSRRCTHPATARTSGSSACTSCRSSSLVGAINLDRDDPQHARAGHVVDAHPALLLGDRHLRVAARDRAADAVRGADADAARPPGGHALLRRGARREPAALPARLLVLRAPRGLHHDPAGDGDRLGDHPRLRAQADLRLQGGRDLDGGHRVLLAARVGAPHVRGRPADRARHLLHAQLDGHRDPDGREDLQLARDDLAREHLVRHADAVGARLHRRLHARRASPASSSPRSRSTGR